MGLHVNGFMFLKLIFKYEIFLLLDAGPDMTILGISPLSDVIKSQEKKKNFLKHFTRSLILIFGSLGLKLWSFSERSPTSDATCTYLLQLFPL